jgi:hypothetical protein
MSSEALKARDHAHASTFADGFGASERDELLAFRAPYLEKKLVRLGVAESELEAARLFQEVKKYLALGELHRGKRLPMFSTRIDEVWHQFVLFTSAYAEFCARFLGRFVHHIPAEYPEAPEAAAMPVMSFDDFRRAYESTFGLFCTSWLDELSLGEATRLRWSGVPMQVRRERDRAVLFRDDDAQTVLCRVSLRAEPALRFIAGHRSFLVRELPGLRDAEERVLLCRPLVRFGVLRLAP